MLSNYDYCFDLQTTAAERPAVEATAAADVGPPVLVAAPPPRPVVQSSRRGEEDDRRFGRPPV